MDDSEKRLHMYLEARKFGDRLSEVFLLMSASKAWQRNHKLSHDSSFHDCFRSVDCQVQDNTHNGRVGDGSYGTWITEICLDDERGTVSLPAPQSGGHQLGSRNVLRYTLSCVFLG